MGLGLLLVGLLMGAQMPPAGEDVFIGPDCKLLQALDCHTIIYQLEMDDRPLTSGDFTKEECEKLKAELLPGLALVGLADKPKCVAYAVKREDS